MNIAAVNSRVDFDVDINEIEREYGFEELPEGEELFTFESGKSYPIKINPSGMEILSPFSFVDKLEIIREEIYDDGSC